MIQQFRMILSRNMFLPIARKVLFLFALLFSALTMAQVQIEIKIPDYALQEVRVFEFEDYYTNKEKLIQLLSTDKDGVCMLNFKTSTVKKISIKTNQTRAFFYAEPDSMYHLQLGKPDTNAVQTLGLEIPVSIYFSNKQEHSLNHQIIYFEQLVSEFYAANNIYFAKPRILQKELLNFKNEILKKEFPNPSAFLKTYIDYSIATIEETIFMNDAYQFKKYFSGSIQYHHPIYMQYFATFYKQYLKQISLKTKGEKLTYEINEMHSYEKAMNTILKADTLLKNDTLRELILLTGLREWYYLKDNNRNNISMLMNFIALKGLSKENRTIAKNLLDDISILEVGKAAPELELNHSKYKSLTDLKGNYVYINFWATWNVESLQELKYIQKLDQKYGNRVIFISIATGENLQEEKKHFSNNKYNWILLHDTDKRIRNEYQIKSIPHYVLLDTEGDIIKGNAPAPSNNMDHFLKQLIRKK